jgi:rifampicin phosphotransferase
MSDTAGTPRFEPPGPGQWQLDRSHYFGGTTPIARWLITESMPAGTRRVFGELGMPVDCLDVRFVHGFMYTRLRPLLSADRPPRRLPPRPVLKLASRLHPAMRRRARLAARTLNDHPWRQVCEDWDARIRPDLERRNLELQDVDVTDLDDEGLARHVDDLLGWARETFELHFWLHGFDLGPIALLVAETKRWGLPAAEVATALKGASPSTSAPARALAGLRAAVADAGRTPRSLAELRALSPEVAAQLDNYLRYKGNLCFSRYDLDGVTLGEVPEVVLATVLRGRDAEEHADTGDVAAALRARVSAAERDRFDDLLEGAREAMDLRDDNGPNTVEWPTGLLRRALLEAGRRLVASGRLAEVEHVFELGPTEVVPLLREGRGPSSDELAARSAQRQADAAASPPPTLGEAEVAPPLDVLPASLASLVAVVQTALEELGMQADDRGGGRGDGLQGTGVGTTRYRGVARQARTPEEAVRALEPGDVLVVPTTTPAYNVVLGLAGAVVTAEGGTLCHAAVLARELGIAAVVGAPGALTEIPDGSEVEVDPATGRVSVVPVP